MSANVLTLNCGQPANRVAIIKSLRDLADSMEAENNYPHAVRCVVVMEMPKSTSSMYFGESATYSNLFGVLEMAKLRWANELSGID